MCLKRGKYDCVQGYKVVLYSYKLKYSNLILGYYINNICLNFWYEEIQYFQSIFINEWKEL